MGPRISWRSGDPSRDASSGLNPEELVAEAESPNEDPAVVRPLSAEAVRKGMLRLGPEDQDMLQAILFDGLTQEEYARRVNITQSGINYRLTRALRRLEWLTVGPYADAGSHLLGGGSQIEGQDPSPIRCIGVGDLGRMLAADYNRGAPVSPWILSAQARFSKSAGPRV